MSHTRRLLFALAIWTCCLATGEIQAQAQTPRNQSQPFVPAQRGRKVVNVNSRGSAPTSTSLQTPDLSQSKPTDSTLTYIAIIGAVNQPAVFETSERLLPLGALVERAGGLSPDSNGTVCMLDRGRSHSIEPIAWNLNLKVGHDQIVYVLPRGGNSPTQLLGSSAVLPSKKILITGLTNGPRLFRVDNQRRTLGDFVMFLGQSVELYERGDITATQPQGVSMNLNSELVANSVISFNPAAMSQDGLHDAFLRGFRLEQPVRFDEPAASTSKPSAAQPTNDRAAVPPPAPMGRKPEMVPRLEPTREGPIPPDTSSLIPETLTPAREPTGIEAAGSSTLTREPLPFPRDTDPEDNSAPSAPNTRGDGRAPLMMPKSWAPSQDESEDNPNRIIERTSAGNSRKGHRVVTASASASSSSEELKPRKTKPASGLDLSEIESEELAEEEAATSSILPGPQSWMILAIVGGIVGASVIVSRLISRPDFASRSSKARSEGFTPSTTPTTAHKSVQAPAPQPVIAKAPADAVATKPSLIPVPAPAPVQAPAPVRQADPVEDTLDEDNHRFLQRLIMNKVTVVEEEPVQPQIDHLHGSAVGASRMIVHEAHETVAGPHFQVRAKGDARELELRLRRLLRTDRLKRREVVVHSGEVRESRETSTGPLERALRSVDRGGTQ